jgi:hypothetical protein
MPAHTRKSLHTQVPPALTAAGVLLTPFKPFAVSFLNSAAMELRFLRRASANPALRPAQRLHAVTCLAGLGAFALEDACPRLPFVHAAWHCLSAAAVSTVNCLLDDVERSRGLVATGGGGHAGAVPVPEGEAARARTSRARGEAEQQQDGLWRSGSFASGGPDLLLAQRLPLLLRPLPAEVSAMCGRQVRGGLGALGLLDTGVRGAAWSCGAAAAVGPQSHPLTSVTG